MEVAVHRAFTAYGRDQQSCEHGIVECTILFLSLLIDVDECFEGIDNCHTYADFVSTWSASYECLCSNGYIGNGTDCCFGNSFLTDMACFILHCSCSQCVICTLSY